jgi:MFS transporter, PHS family, inorganic phosphate transporter
MPSPQESMLWHIVLQLVVFTVAALPGYLLAAAMMDRIGRKSIQILGFAVMAMTFGAMALIPGIEKLVVPFVIIYGISYFFTEFGPNATTFVYPAEIFPVEARTTGHGIAAAAGKLGGFVGVFLFPILLSWNGLLAAESAAAIVSILGLSCCERLAREITSSLGLGIEIGGGNTVPTDTVIASCGRSSCTILPPGLRNMTRIAPSTP